MRHLLIMLTLFGWVSVLAGDNKAVPDFSMYPQTESFRYFLSFHTNAISQFQHTNLLVISAFPRGDRMALQYRVTDSGQESDHRYAYNWAIQASHRKQIDETNLSRLRTAIQLLPPESASPPIERLVIVSFHEGTNWVSRSYDSDALPKPMRQIYDIIGERFETRKDK